MENFLIPALILLYLSKPPTPRKARPYDPLSYYAYHWSRFVYRLLLFFGLSLLVAYAYGLVI